MAKLFIYPKKGDSYAFALNKERVTIGRAADNDLPLQDQFSSSRHAVVCASEKGFVVQDQGSKNGTFLNGKRIPFESPLKKGDEILVGSTRIIFDQELSTNVEIVEGAPLEENLNTIINVKDILKKRSIETTIRVPGAPLDLAKIEQEQKVLAVMNEVSQALIYHMPLEKLLDHIMDLILKNVPMDRGVLMLKEGSPEQLVPKVVRVVNMSLANQNIQVSQTILLTALEKNSAILVSDIQSDTQFRSQASVIQLNIHSAMCVPLWNNQEIIGLIYLDRIQLLEQFTEGDLKLLTLLANLAAVKIENAKLFEQALEKCRMEREMALASQIQKNFLPRCNPDFAGYDICGSNRSCHEIGGDYYDFIPIEKSRLGIAVADVSGCGVSASLLMASLRASLHAEINPRYSLAHMASKLNDFVHQSSELNSFITFFFGDLEREAGLMRYVNAGHNSPIILRKDGSVDRLESTGFCLGMFQDVTYEVKAMTLHPGDTACFFTDGISECRNTAKQEFGEENLIDAMKRHSGLSSSEIIKKIFEEIHAFSISAELDDDMTVVVVKRSAQA